jgi:hypothetical protein
LDEFLQSTSLKYLRIFKLVFDILGVIVMNYFRIHVILLLLSISVGFETYMGTAHASVALNSKLQDGVNTLQDLDFERILRVVGGVETYVTGQIQAGDILEAALSFDTLNALNLKTQLFNTNYQFTAYSRVIVQSVDNPGGPLSNFNFLPGLGGNVAIEVYENTVSAPLDFVSPDTAAVSIANAKSGTLVATLGFQDADDFWVALGAPVNTALLTSTLPGQLIPGQFFFGLSVLSNPGGLNIVDEGVVANNLRTGQLNIPVDVQGGGQLKGKPTDVLGVSAQGWHVETDTTINFRSAVIPEPTSIFVWALLTGALSFVGFRRSRA